ERIQEGFEPAIHGGGLLFIALERARGAPDHLCPLRGPIFACLGVRFCGTPGFGPFACPCARSAIAFAPFGGGGATPPFGAPAASARLNASGRTASDGCGGTAGRPGARVAEWSGSGRAGTPLLSAAAVMARFLEGSEEDFRRNRDRNCVCQEEGRTETAVRRDACRAGA